MILFDKYHFEIIMNYYSKILAMNLIVTMKISEIVNG